MVEAPPPLSNATARVIVLLYGSMANGKPFWLFAAVKPESYEDFQKAQKDNTLNFNAFEPYGEVIVAGEGQTPPPEVTLKIAEVYQTDPSKFFEKPAT